MAGFLARSGHRSIDLSAAAYLELGLVALQRADYARAAGCFASIDDDSWAAITVRFPSFAEWLEKWEPTR